MKQPTACIYSYDAVENTKEEDPTGLLNEGFRYRDLETGVFITKDPIGNELMMPKEKWMVDGREVSEREYQQALNPGVAQAGNGPSKTAKDSGQEADYNAATSEAGGPKSVWHTAAAGFPNLYTYVNENPWTFFDPEGLDANDPNLVQRVAQTIGHFFTGKLNQGNSGAQGSGRFEKFMPFIAKWENVYNSKGQVVAENVTGDHGGVTKFGIDQASHPNVDVANLTQKGANSIYHGEWNSWGIESHQYPLGEVFFNAKVNGGGDSLLRQSGGNADKLLDAQEARYKALAAKPGQAKFLKGWLSRTQDLRRYIHKNDKDKN